MFAKENKGNISISVDEQQLENLIDKTSDETQKKSTERTPIFEILSCTVGSSFQFGYHCGCINLPADLIRNWFIESHEKLYGVPIAAEETELIWAIAVGIFAVGGMFGAIFVGRLADRFGRKPALLYNNLLAFIGISLLTAAKYVNIYWLFVIGRFIIGLNAGINSGLVPMYLTEISPTKLRGSVGSIAQLVVTISILISQIVGLPFLFGNSDWWPFIFGFAMIPMAFQICTLPFCPESPKFSLAFKGNALAAERDLKKLRGRDNVNDELEQILAESSSAEKGTSNNFQFVDLFKKPLNWPLTLAIFMHLSQQFSGINAAIFYSTTIFKKSGLAGQMPNYATLMMGTVNVLMTIVSTWLAISTFMIAISMIASKTIHWFSFVTIIFVIFMVVSVATGPGSIPWFYVNEIFPMNARASANSVAVFTNWASNSLVATLFPLLENIFREYTFFIFTIFLCLFIIFGLKYMPETKNKTLAEVEEAIGQKKQNEN
ncbi:hypothetical protein niasHS_005145 [Heterodera schachtii]|uniref:Major facilitator superfamily (MFS) profile domain-containing protein n=1 Tax=Heterodera schachtii TaxID=97005 RepID=A0ABD2JRT0_HETSC